MQNSNRLYVNNINLKIGYDKLKSDIINDLSNKIVDSMWTAMAYAVILLIAVPVVIYTAITQNELINAYIMYIIVAFGFCAISFSKVDGMSIVNIPRAYFDKRSLVSGQLNEQKLYSIATHYYNSDALRAACATSNYQVITSYIDKSDMKLIVLYINPGRINVMRDVFDVSVPGDFSPSYCNIEVTENSIKVV